MIFTSLSPKHIYINNPAHLGDCVFTLIALQHVKKYIEEHNIYIVFFCNVTYHNQLKEFINSNHVTLQPYNPEYNMGVPLWIGQNYIMNQEEKKLIRNDYYSFNTIYYNNVFKKLSIPHIMTEITYSDNELIDRYYRVMNSYSPLKNTQILIINSEPMSGQYTYDIEEFNAYTKKLAEIFNVVVTRHIDTDIPCTVSYGLNIKDIAAISINVDVIIAINTGPFVGLLNTYTMNRVKQFYIFDEKEKYILPKFQMKEKITDIPIDELRHYIS